MPRVTVADGDCITSIADAHGFFWQTLWDHPENADLRNRREDPNVLRAGDVVFVPELRERWESGDTEARHRFRKKGVPGLLRLRLMREPEPEGEAAGTQDEGSTWPPPASSTTRDPVEEAGPEDEPRADVDVRIEIDGRISEARTDSDGRIEISIPPGARSGRLVIEPGTERETTLPLRLGHLNPLATVSGMKQRLSNLGFSTGEESDRETPEFLDAVREFQRRHGLEPSGEVDAGTQQAVRDAHGE